MGHIPESSVEERTIELERDQLGNLDLDLDVGYTRNKPCPILKNSYSSLRPLVQHRGFLTSSQALAESGAGDFLLMPLREAELLSRAHSSPGWGWHGVGAGVSRAGPAFIAWTDRDQ